MKVQSGITKYSDENAKALDQVDWNFLFFNKNVHEQVSILNRTLINVFSKFIPNKLGTFNDKDPLWMTSDLRDKINWKNSIYNNIAGTPPPLLKEGVGPFEN